MDLDFGMRQHIADLHCDLLCYLAGDSKRSPNDLEVRCAIPQLKQGNVKLQTMAIFTTTEPGSSKSGLAQAQVFKHLPKRYPEAFEVIRDPSILDHLHASNCTGILASVENASGFAEETDSFDQVLKNLHALQNLVGKIAYISLTWNSENRFGGGAHSNIGLKEDGKRLLDYMAQKHIPVDFSHASDQLAHDIFNYLDKTNSKLPVLASHSNMRSVTDVPRNLPDELTKEILNRKGIIGLNFVRYFVGSESANYFIRQLEHLLSLGGGRNVCFGADFFYNGDVPLQYRKKPEEEFFVGFDHSGTYHRVLELWRGGLAASPEMISDISYQNLSNFLKTSLFVK